MKLRIEIDLDNAAFEDGGVDEVARLLESIGSRLPDSLTDTNGKLNLHDADGNHCGFAEISDADSDRETLLKALRRIMEINGSTGGAKALVAEFKHIAVEAVGKVE